MNRNEKVEKVPSQKTSKTVKLTFFFHIKSEFYLVMKTLNKRFRCFLKIFKFIDD